MFNMDFFVITHTNSYCYRLTIHSYFEGHQFSKKTDTTNMNHRQLNLITQLLYISLLNIHIHCGTIIIVNYLATMIV